MPIPEERGDNERFAPPPINHGLVIDISMPLNNGTQAYPGDTPFHRRVVQNFGQDGEGCMVSAVSMSAHSGTHVDAPRHFIAGARPIDAIAASRWISNALVVHVPSATVILPRHLPDAALRPGLSVLFRTGNSDRPAPGGQRADACFLSLEAARVLVSKGINMAGIDGLSVEDDNDSSWPVHRTLLAGDVLILEGIRLGAVEPGPCTLVVAPLLMSGSEAAPARVFLLY
jgi:arylformamidase